MCSVKLLWKVAHMCLWHKTENSRDLVFAEEVLFRQRSQALLRVVKVKFETIVLSYRSSRLCFVSDQVRERQNWLYNTAHLSCTGALCMPCPYCWPYPLCLNIEIWCFVFTECFPFLINYIFLNIPEAQVLLRSSNSRATWQSMVMPTVERERKTSELRTSKSF